MNFSISLWNIGMSGPRSNICSYSFFYPQLTCIWWWQNGVYECSLVANFVALISSVTSNTLQVAKSVSNDAFKYCKVQQHKFLSNLDHNQSSAVRKSYEFQHLNPVCRGAMQAIFASQVQWGPDKWDGIYTVFLSEQDGLDGTNIHDTIQHRIYEWDTNVSGTLDSARRVSHYTSLHCISRLNGTDLGGCFI